jgi:hypothetical protein
MKKEVMKQEEMTTEVATVDMSMWGDVVVETKDLILPRIILQQALSEAVKTRTANDGDYLNTLSAETFQSKPVLPFFCVQYYNIEKFNGKKFEFLRKDPYVPGIVRQWEENTAEGRLKVTHVYEYFCMTKDSGTPVIVSFKSTSHKAGQQLFNLMYVQNPQMGKTPAHNWINLGRKEETSKDGDKYFVMSISVDESSVPSDIESCFKWIPIVRKAAFKTAEEKPSTQQPITETRF